MIIADTHALIWWVNGELDQLPHTTRGLLDDADLLGVAAISCWEIALLSARRRITIHGNVREWLETVTTATGVAILPIKPAIATSAAELRDSLRDPADCLIVATALHHHAPLVTKDARIRASGLVETIW